VFVKKALRLSDDIKYCCWSDSQVALSWIKGDPHRCKPFVANRVVEIQELTSPSCWSYCPGADNPADLMTRGLAASELVMSKLWLSVPTFLSNTTTEFGKCNEVILDPSPRGSVIYKRHSEGQQIDGSSNPTN
jgi:hypothetical protein